MPLDQSVRPTPGGYEIQCSGRMSTGTLGATILWSPNQGVEYRIGVTNAHVLPNKGAAVLQPNEVTHADHRTIGYVDAVCPGKPYGSSQEYFADTERREDARFDFAYFFALERETSTRIAGGVYSGPPGGGVGGIDPPALALRPPRIGDRVRWIGKTSAAVRTGKIESITFWAFMARNESQGHWVGIDELIKIKPIIGPSQNGDSGAALVADDQRIVGLYCGSTMDGKFEVGSRIPVDEFDLGMTSLVTEEVARQRYELYRQKPKTCVVQ